MSGLSLLDLGIRGAAAGYRDKSWSPVEVIHEALAAIAATEPCLHAWASVAVEGAVATAKLAEQDFASKIDRGLMQGMPIGIKDIFDVAGLPTRCGSAARHDATAATRSATVVQTLQDAGAVILGKTVTQEFAAGVVSPPARNPWDISRIPGGSSGGSAVALAAGSCLGAMGSDTGGSIRIPAAACGVVGFKPAFGSLDVTGVYPLSWSLDTVGPLARTVDDAWIMWRTLLGDVNAQPVNGSISGLRIGVPRAYFFDWLQPDVLRVTNEAMEALRSRGATIVDAPWALAAAARAAAFIINRVETSAVHETAALRDSDRFALYGPELRLRVAAGRPAPAALYVQAVRAREVVRDSIAQLFSQVRLDVLLAPTLPTTAVPADDVSIVDTGLDESLGVAWTRLTMPFNATGQPVLAAPAGFDRQGLPVGVQLVGRPGHETPLFRAGRALEEAVDPRSFQPPACLGKEA